MDREQVSAKRDSHTGERLHLLRVHTSGPRADGGQGLHLPLALHRPADAPLPAAAGALRPPLSLYALSRRDVSSLPILLFYSLHASPVGALCPTSVKYAFSSWDIKFLSRHYRKLSQVS